MSKRLKIIHEKQVNFFGKPKQLTYEAYEFENGKVAYVGEDGNVYADKREALLETLNKQGTATIEEVKKARKP